MVRSWLALPFLLCAATGWSNEGPASAALTSPIRLPANVGFSSQISEDQRASTVLFDNCCVELQPVVQGARGPASATTAVQTKLVTLHFPYTSGQAAVQMVLDVRGFVNLQSGAIARLVVMAGDATQSVVLEPCDRPVKLKGKAKETLMAEHSQSTVGNFEGRVCFCVHPQSAKPACPVTLVLCLERDTDAADSGSGLLAVDSLDLEVVSGNAKHRP